jgi:hypothetical protein
MGGGDLWLEQQQQQQQRSGGGSSGSSGDNSNSRGLTSVGDRCESLGQQQQQHTRSGKEQQVVSRGDSGRAAGAARAAAGLGARGQRRSELLEEAEVGVDGTERALS